MIARKKRSFIPSSLVLVSVLLIASTASSAATPPTLVNYQGVLRNASNAPLTGTYDVVFRLYSAATGGDQILVDSHTAAVGAAVTVTGGLFNTLLGGGSVTDGTGPGTYTSLDPAFRDYDTVYLDVQVGTETLSPRTRIAAAAYALNASNLGGRAPSAFLDTSAGSQTKSGALTVSPSGAGAIAVTGQASSAGGYFKDSDTSGYAYVGYGDEGIAGYGNLAGGYFQALDVSSFAYVGVADGGIEAWGNQFGGYFKDLDSSGVAYVGYGDYGIHALGNTGGGEFYDGDNSGHAYVGYGDHGIEAYGYDSGGYFADTSSSGLAYVGYGDRGIWGKGTFAGGTFSHPDNVTYWADVSQIIGGTTYKIRGTGTVAFVQNHPTERDKVVVYAAPEGDEVAVYTRGSARLASGEAHVALGETFALVANPDIGLTAHLTPRGEPVPLSVVSLTTSELLVRGPADSNTEFDYLVYGLRIGFEEHGPIQVKDREALLPPREAMEAFYSEHPDLRRFGALERFKAMRAALGEAGEPDLSRSRALAAAIDGDREAVIAKARAEAAAEEAERATPKPPSLPEERVPVSQPAPTGSTAAAIAARAPAPAEIVTSEPRTPSPAPAAAVTASVSFATLPVSEVVEAGDVLVLDADHAGTLRRGQAGMEPLVVGISSAPSAEGQVMVAVSGVIPFLVDAGYGAIRPGDLLMVSPTPGHAMRAGEAVAGAVLGKALEGLDIGQGIVSVLVTPR